MQLVRLTVVSNTQESSSMPALRPSSALGARVNKRQKPASRPWYCILEQHRCSLSGLEFHRCHCMH